MHGRRYRRSPIKHLLEEKVDGKWVDKPHDHQGSGKIYGERGHAGEKTHWTESEKRSGYRKAKIKD